MAGSPSVLRMVPDQHCRGDKNAFIQTDTTKHPRPVHLPARRTLERPELAEEDRPLRRPQPRPVVQKAGSTSDLNQRWPFGDGEIGVFRAHDALEHLSSPIHTMQEAHRCLTPGSSFLTLTPSTDCRGAFQDPTYVSFWNSNSFWYYTRPEQARFIVSPVLFEANRVRNFYPSD